MKKLFALIMCLSLVLVTGCSSISREEYENLIAENSRLESDYEQLLMEKNDLANMLDEAKTRNKAITDCFELCNEMLGRPNAAIAKENSEIYLDGISEDSYFYLEEKVLSGKSIITFNRSMPSAEIAGKIKVHTDANSEDITNILLTSSIKSSAFIYRYDNGKVIMSHYWYKDSNDNVQERLFWFSKEVGDEYDKLK